MKLQCDLISYSFKLLTFEKDRKEVHQFLIKNKNYLIWQDGEEISEKTTEDFFYGSLPTQNSYNDKFIIGAYQTDQLFCVFDILKNYPITGTWVIGLMLLAKESRGKGTGAKLFEALEKCIRENNVIKIRLGVLEDNDIGRKFWKRMGFVENGEVRPHADGRKILVMETRSH